MKNILILSSLLLVASGAMALEKVGVKVCDDFALKYEQCLKKKGMKDTSSLDAMVNQWKEMKKTSESALASACETTKKQIEGTMKDCNWK